MTTTTTTTKKLQGKLTISRPDYGNSSQSTSVFFEIKDCESAVVFLEFSVSDSDLIDALRGRAFVEADLEVSQLDKVGKTKTIKQISFELPPNTKASERAILAEELVDKFVLEVYGEGWTASKYFSSQNSFTTDKVSGNLVAHTHISRWD